MEWQKLRIWNGSQANAFEALVCQLAEYEPRPADSKFIRKGTPDGGVECFLELPSGSEHGWQAKFFTAPPSSSQWAQVDSSVKTALNKHPALNQYTISLPVDRSDSRVDDHKTFLDRWNDRVTKWEGWAAAKGMHVEFRYWGSHEIVERLSREEHRGRFFFWFHEELFTPVWFQQRLEEAIAKVGPRYTPELNVKLPLSALFDGLSRSPEFFRRFQQAYGEVGKAWSKGLLRDVTDLAPAQAEDFYQHLVQIVDIAKGYDKPGINTFDWTLLEHWVIDALRSTSNIYRLISDLSRQADETKSADTQKNSQQYPEKDRFDYALYRLANIRGKLFELGEFLKSDLAQLANDPALLLVGPAGTGKTHLFSDAARNHIQANAPAVLLLGIEFQHEEPWDQIIRILNLSCTRDEFLGGLETAAQLCGRRAIIFIDALNEGNGRNIWETHLPSMLACLSRYPWIAIAVSVRSSYENLVIPDGLVPEKLVRAVHVGFADQEYQAAKAFFEYYGIELPAIPILTPEFQNPLFLRCFCRGLQNRGLARIPTGIQGITSVFEFFLDSVNEKLAKPNYIDFDSKANLVGQATQKLAEWLSQSSESGIPRTDAQRICNGVLPDRTFDRSLFRHLLSEGVLAETIAFDETGQHHEIVTFSYERLADHLVMRQLLTQHVGTDDSASAFVRGQPLNKYFEDETACWQNRGLVEALAIQGPELLKKEIYELLPNIMESRPVCEALIESLLWRDPKTISDKSLSYINQHVVPNNILHFKLLDALLTIAANPDHPFNADFLHQNLIKRELAERDAWWSIFLDEEYGQRSSLDRLVDWAWSNTDRKHISDEAIRLTAQVLIWFLTTPHRFLRDRATKALVSLLSQRIHVLCQLIVEFAHVNDAYVLERLYAVAYGCAMRNNDSEAKRTLAQVVYDVVFKEGSPPPHILLRDYARGVVEVALRDGLGLKDVEPKRIRPPYQSEWPLEIPSKEDVETYGEWSKDMPDEQWALHSIYSSVMEWGDFARYILGSDGGTLHWSNRPLNEPRTPTRKEQFEAFVTSLTERQKKEWNVYWAIVQGLEMYRRLDAEQRQNYYGQEFSEVDLRTVIHQAEQQFTRTLGKRKADIFSNVVIPYLELSPSERDELALPVSMAQRWILKRVFDLGWTVEHFGRFDRSQGGNYDAARSAHKAERMGKKYQWLAYHEFLAHLADNLEFREDTWSERLEIYQGPWQLWLRDIDPSCLLKSTRRSQWEPNVTAWWAPARFEAWAEEPDEIQWRKRIDLLPPVSLLPTVTDPETGIEYFVLECFYDWEEPTPPDMERFDIRRRYIWYILKSYLVKAEDEQRFCDWAKDQHFMGRWMPESHQETRVYLGELFWAPAFQYFDTPYYGRDNWTRGHQSEIPCEVLVTTDEYMQEHGTYDCSIDNTISIYLPAKWITDKMKLSWRGVDGCYFDPEGKLVAQDPSVKMPGPRALLIDKELMGDFLDTEGYRLVWTLLGEKDIRGHWGRDENWPGRMELSGCLNVNNGHVEGLATAYWVTQGPLRTRIATISIP